jgi:hypothetical protein
VAQHTKGDDSNVQQLSLRISTRLIRRIDKEAVKSKWEFAPACRNLIEGFLDRREAARGRQRARHRLKK